MCLKPRHILLSYCRDVVVVRRDKLLKGSSTETPSKGNVKFTTEIIYDCYYLPKYYCLSSAAPCQIIRREKKKQIKKKWQIFVDIFNYNVFNSRAVLPIFAYLSARSYINITTIAILLRIASIIPTIKNLFYITSRRVYWKKKKKHLPPVIRM